MGLYAIASMRDLQGRSVVAVAAQRTKGVFLSFGEDYAELEGMSGKDVRELCFQLDGGVLYLWAGSSAVGNETGCHVTQVNPQLAADWHSPSGWTGGGCHAIAVHNGSILAATHSAGLLSLESRTSKKFERVLQPGITPLPDGGVEPLNSIPFSKQSSWGLGGTSSGVYRSQSPSESYVSCSQKEFHEHFSIPQDWLICSGEHKIEVVHEDG